MKRHRLLRGWWIGKHLFALVILAMLVTLAVWQFNRLTERRAANAAQLAGLARATVAYPLGGGDLSSLIGGPVEVSGTFLHEESIVLRARPSGNGVTGVELVTPLLLADGTAVLVNRGWLPTVQGTPAARAAYALSGEQTIQALVMADQPRPNSPLAGRDLPLPGETRVDAWLRVDISAIQPQVSAALAPVWLQQLPAAGRSGLPRPADPTVVDEGPHLNYALQWITFAVLLTIVYGALMVQEIRRDQTER
jgi:surfeit locus 1 family protein